MPPVEKPIFDCEMESVKCLDQDVFVKKDLVLGITELLLRYMSWLCVRDSTYADCRFMIVTGPRINLAEDRYARVHFKSKDIF
jgi:hypothetical protein